VADWRVFARYPDARMFFRDVRMKTRLAREYRFVIDNGPQPHGGGGHAGISDPTAARAIFMLTTDARERERAQRKLDSCEKLIAVGWRAVRAIDAGLGGRSARAVKLHYLDDRSIREVAETMGASAATVKRDVGIALDWLDSQKVSEIFG